MPLALGNLSDELDRIAGDESEIADVILQVCCGLEYIHDQGIVHRDLKPDNILHILPGVWAISDFGLGKEEERQTTAITRTGDWAGTLFYAAPEQFTDAKNVGKEVDIYAMGKILQELVTNELPQTTADMPGRFRQVVVRATSRERAERHQSVEEFLQHFSDCLSEGSPVWKSPSEILATNRERLNGDMADDAAIRELMEIDFRFDEFSVVENNDILSILVTISNATIESVWSRDSEWLRVFFSRFCNYISRTSFGFGFCDPLSNFCLRVCRVTADPQILHSAIVSLLALGRQHNRWHVQGVVIKLLQDAKTHDDAVNTLAALRSADKRDVQWGLNEFAIGSMHPVLRMNIPALLESEDSGIVDWESELDDVPF